MGDGGWTVEFLEKSAFTAIRRLGADGKKSQPYQPLARAGWCRFSLAVLFPPDPNWAKSSDGWRKGL